jgi:hypothetical protein
VMQLHYKAWFRRCIQVRWETEELLSHGAKQPLNSGIDGMHNIISPWRRLLNEMGLAGTCVASMGENMRLMRLVRKIGPPL